MESCKAEGLNRLEWDQAAALIRNQIIIGMIAGMTFDDAWQAIREAFNVRIEGNIDTLYNLLIAPQKIEMILQSVEEAKRRRAQDF